MTGSGEVGRRFITAAPLHLFPSDLAFSHSVFLFAPSPSRLVSFGTIHSAIIMFPARFARAGLRATAQQFSVPRTAAVNGLRSYATPAQEARPPVALFGVDGTYATALVRFLLSLPPIPRYT